MSPLSTDEVARKIGVRRITLERWIRGGRLKGPRTVTIGRRTLRLWGEGDIERAQRFKEKYYRKGRGRKKKQE